MTALVPSQPTPPRLAVPSKAAPEHWHRMAIADEAVRRLPPTVYLTRMPELLGVPFERVLAAIEDGTLVTAGRGPRRRMVCAQSRAFLESDPAIRAWLQRD